MNILIKFNFQLISVVIPLVRSKLTLSVLFQKNSSKRERERECKCVCVRERALERNLPVAQGQLGGWEVRLQLRLRMIIVE